MIGQKVFIELVDVGTIGHGRAFFPDNKDRRQMLHALTHDHEQVKDHLIYGVTQVWRHKCTFKAF